MIIKKEHFRAFTLGLMDGLTVPISVASGMVASLPESQQVSILTKRFIIIAILAESIAGSISMGLSEYTSVDDEEENNISHVESGVLTSFGYILGACIPMLSYIYAKNIQQGFKISIILNFLALLFFGYIRARVLKISIMYSIQKVIIIGFVSMIVTYYIISLLKQ